MIGKISVFFLLILQFVLAYQFERDSTTIHFSQADNLDKYRTHENGARSPTERLQKEDAITFVDNKTESNMWSFGTNYNSNSNLSESNQRQRNNNIQEGIFSFGMVDKDRENNWLSQLNDNKKIFSNNYEQSSDSSSNRRLLPESICGIDLPRRILGGSSADIDEFPWLALLQYKKRNSRISYDCGGTLISSRYVVTAAHCTIGLGVTTRKLKLEKVRLGEWDLSTETDCQHEICNKYIQDIEIEEIINHPSYKPRQNSQTNDISLLRLKREAEINQFVHPICLPLDDVAKINFEGKRMSIAGWGRTKNVKESNSNIKMKVEVPVIAWESCHNFYGSFYNVKLEKTQICAGGEDGKDSCQGDSGGPLMSSEKIEHEFRWFLIGVISSGPAACGVEGRPSIYTKVPDFVDWILKNMKE